MGCRFEFTTQKLPLQRISANFSFFINFGHHAKKGNFSILAVFQNVWDLHKFGLQIWIQNAKITLWKNFGQFFRFHRFWSSGPGMQKKIISQILAVIQNIWDLHKFGLQIWIQNTKITLWKNFGQFFWFHRFWSSGPCMQKLPYERISGNFSDFIDFGHQVRVCKKTSFPSISCISKYMNSGLTYIWVADLNSDRKNYPMKEFRTIFPISSIWVIRF